MAEAKDISFFWNVLTLAQVKCCGKTEVSNSYKTAQKYLKEE